MEWFFKKYDELRINELYELLKLRASVFVVEQDCPYLDLDGKDSLATHMLGYEEKNSLPTLVFSVQEHSKKKK